MRVTFYCRPLCGSRSDSSSDFLQVSTIDNPQDSTASLYLVAPASDVRMHTSIGPSHTRGSLEHTCYRQLDGSVSAWWAGWDPGGRPLALGLLDGQKVGQQQTAAQSWGKHWFTGTRGRKCKCR